VALDLLAQFASGVPGFACVAQGAGQQARRERALRDETDAVVAQRWE
jgi:hypothetical protein